MDVAKYEGMCQRGAVTWGDGRVARKEVLAGHLVVIDKLFYLGCEFMSHPKQCAYSDVEEAHCSETFKRGGRDLVLHEKGGEGRNFREGNCGVGTGRLIVENIPGGSTSL